MSVNLQFPSSNNIVQYLEKHPLTNGPIFKENDLLSVTANAFANQKKRTLNVQIGVMNVLYGHNVEVDLDNEAMLIICINLTAALKDCAMGKKIELEKNKTSDSSQ